MKRENDCGIPNELTLHNGVTIPCIGNGPGIPYIPYNNENYIVKQLHRVYNKLYARPCLLHHYVEAVSHSFQVGYRLLDYSSSYGDGTLIGKAIKRSRIDRKELFLTTRISNPAQRSGEIKKCFFQQLKGMGTDYIDLLMFHWPVTDYYLDTWKEMVNLYNAGYCRAIGVANCHPHHIEHLIKATGFVPMVNQVEIHPLFTQKELINYCRSKNIVVEGYTAIARFDDRLMRLPLLHQIARKYNKTVVQLILRWHIQPGVITIVRSMNKKRQLENISIFDFELSMEEMNAINGININSRLRYDPDNCDFSIL